MNLKFTTAFLFCLILACFPHKSAAQLTDYIFGLDNISLGNYQFSKIEKTTGNITYMQTLPFSTFNGYESASVDVDNGLYYFCKGKFLVVYDAINGVQLSIINLNLVQNQEFGYVQFNPCDGMLYGIITGGTAITFNSYDLASGTFTTIDTLPPNTQLCISCNAVIKSSPNYYIIQTTTSLLTYDISTGNLVYNTTIIDLPNEIFGHIEMKCGTELLYGTSANTNLGLKYLSTVDPITGIVAHLSGNGWTQGVFKPLSGGNCIDQPTGEYYYSGAGHLLISANTLTGNQTAVQYLPGNGDLKFVRHFSDCDCELSAVENAGEALSVSMFPNPANTTVSFTFENNGEYEIAITDVSGRLFKKQTSINNGTFELNISELNPGYYLVLITSKAGTYQSKLTVIHE